MRTPSTHTCVLRVLTHAARPCFGHNSFRARTHTNVHAPSRTHTRTHTQTDTQTHTHARRPTPTRAHAHAHAHAHARPRAQVFRAVARAAGQARGHVVRAADGPRGGPTYPRDPQCLGMGLVVLFSVRCAGLSTMHLPRHQRCMHSDTRVCVCVRARFIGMGIIHTPTLTFTHAPFPVHADARDDRRRARGRAQGDSRRIGDRLLCGQDEAASARCPHLGPGPPPATSAPGPADVAPVRVSMVIARGCEPALP
jgi:hypothetical protein